MIHFKLLACMASAGTGSGALAGGTYYLISIQQDNNIKWTYLLTAKEEIKNNKESLTKAKCFSEKNCTLFKSNKVFSTYIDTDDIKEPIFTKIKKTSDIYKSTQYVIQIDNVLLDEKDNLEVVFKKHSYLFEVSSKAVLEKNNNVIPTLPVGILPIESLQGLSPNRSFDDLSNDQKTSRKYHINQYPNKIYREDIKHEDFLIFNWKPDQGQNAPYLYWSFQDQSPIDKYLFKPFEDQVDDPIDNSYLTLNFSNVEQSQRGWLEIYEIKDQTSLREVFKDEKDKASKKGLDISSIKWDEISKENIMVTKFSALEEGKYYKFVFFYLDSFKDKFTSSISDVVLKKVTPNGLTQKLLEFTYEKDEVSSNMCMYMKDKQKYTFCKYLGN